ncbi:MAG TPA: cation diffusion facilitator family transporter [Polyangiaceae bacterium]|nr:cation diffusion facilitator family transporter [Polyangiaceae bacterium]
MSAGGSIKVIIGSLAVNVAIALSKGVAAAVTGSGAMLAEAIHSSADCTNQILLLIGAKQAETPADETHPLGYGRAAYFWSFLVALMIFFGGGVFSIREGVHKIIHPDPVEHVWAGFAVLGVSLVLEGAATVQCYRAINAQRGPVPFFAFLRRTTDVDVVVLFAENAAAVVGLCFAIAALALAVLTGDAHWDGYGSAVIGVLLTLVAGFLGREVKSLLDGEKADPRIEQAFRDEVKADARLGETLRVITLQQGPSQVLLAAKLSVQKGVVSQELVEAFNRLEERVKKRCPEVKWQFIEPDSED